MVGDSLPAAAKEEAQRRLVLEQNPGGVAVEEALLAVAGEDAQQKLG